MKCQKCLFPLTFTAAHLRSHNAERKPDRESERRDSTVNKETENQEPDYALHIWELLSLQSHGESELFYRQYESRG